MMCLVMTQVPIRRLLLPTKVADPRSELSVRQSLEGNQRYPANERGQLNRSGMNEVRRGCSGLNHEGCIPVPSADGAKSPSSYRFHFRPSLCLSTGAVANESACHEADGRSLYGLLGCL